MKKLVAFLLATQASRVFLALVFNVVRTFSEPLWRKIEYHFYNPYDFGETNIAYSKGIADRILATCQGNGLELAGKRRLELGPGGFLGVGAYLKMAGLGEYCVIDSINHFERLVEKTQGYYTSIAPDFVNDGHFNPSYVKILAFDGGAIPAEDSSLDVVVSNAVYEHVHDPAGSIRELARIARCGGLSIHPIDYRDHIFDQKSLYFLTIPGRIFDRLFKKTSGWTNRWRHSDFRKAFTSSGFEILEEQPVCEYGAETVAKYARKLPKISREDLPVSSGFFVARRK